MMAERAHSPPSKRMPKPKTANAFPVSSAIRQRGMAPNASFMAFGVVPSFCSRSTSPTSSNRQYQLDRSPRSRPMVSFACEQFLICLAATVLTFFIAGLLYLLCFEHVDNLGAYSIPSETGLLIPSDFVSYRGTLMRFGVTLLT